MIKYICDFCQTEIKDISENGEFKIQQKQLAFLNHQKSTQIGGRGYLLCVDCAKKVEDFINNGKKK